MSLYTGRHRAAHEPNPTSLPSTATRPRARLSAAVLLSGALFSTIGMTAGAPSAAAAPAPAVSAAPVLSTVNGAHVVSIAASLSGIFYRYGGTTPRGFDCSGFTQYVYARAGKAIPRTVAAQRKAGRQVAVPQLGDLVVFGTSHVGIYAGNGKMYDSPRTGRTTGVHPIYSKGVVYIRF